MCLLLLAWNIHPHYDLVLAANRDEHYARPTAPLDVWIDQPAIRAGRDLQAAGTWLAAHTDGRFAAVTNFRDESSLPPDLRSRGELITDFLGSGQSPKGFAELLQARADRYAGFNLLLGDAGTLWYASNRASSFAVPLAPGIYGLSNHLLDTSWPKVEAGRASLQLYIDRGMQDPELLFDALAQRDAVASQLPWPASSGAFIAHPHFGTRASTVMRREPHGNVLMEERRFAAGGVPRGSTRLQFGGAGANA